MSATPVADFSRLCLHTITTRPWTIEEATRRYAAAGVRGVTVWRQWLEGRDTDAGRKGIPQRRAGGRFALPRRVLCRPGRGRPAGRHRREPAGDRRGRGARAPLIVLVCGAVPGQPLEASRGQIADGIAAVAGRAAGRPKSAWPSSRCTRCTPTPARRSTRSARPTTCATGWPRPRWAWPWTCITSGGIPSCGPRSSGAAAAGGSGPSTSATGGRPTEDLLNDRGLMGEGCIPLRQIRGWVEEAGFHGLIEVEIFSNRHWATDQAAFLAKIQAAYLAHV